MMRKVLLVLVVSAALTAAVLAASGTTGNSKVTVGDFAVKVAHAIGKPATSPNAAINSLKNMGVKISNANADLTEETAQRILGALGVAVTTSNPDSALTTGKADQLVSIVALVGTAGTGLQGNDLPVLCLESRNRGVCENCCKEYYGCDGSGCEFASGCAKFCKSVLPPGKQSPLSPTD